MNPKQKLQSVYEEDFLQFFRKNNENIYFQKKTEAKKLPSYRAQSIDLLCKSTDWFLYEQGFP